jgi:hypothetical protein
MLRLFAVAGFALVATTSAQAITPAPLPQPDGMITQVRLGCGPGRTRVAVSAWPEPPSAIPAEPTAGVTERNRTGVRSIAIGRQLPAALDDDYLRSDYVSGYCPGAGCSCSGQVDKSG